MKIAVVDDMGGYVKDLCKIVELAGFEPIPVHVDHSNMPSLKEVVEKITGADVVLLDHGLGSSFFGKDVATHLPKNIAVISTSDMKCVDEYCTNRIRGKGPEMMNGNRLDSMIEQVRDKVSAILPHKEVK